MLGGGTHVAKGVLALTTVYAGFIQPWLCCRLLWSNKAADIFLSFCLTAGGLYIAMFALGRPVLSWPVVGMSARIHFNNSGPVLAKWASREMTVHRKLVRIPPKAGQFRDGEYTVDKRDWPEDLRWLVEKGSANSIIRNPNGEPIGVGIFISYSESLEVYPDPRLESTDEADEDEFDAAQP